MEIDRHIKFSDTDKAKMWDIRNCFETIREAMSGTDNIETENSSWDYDSLSTVADILKDFCIAKDIAIK